jgi:hypothetical protein
MGAKRRSDMEIRTPKVYYETLQFIKLRLVWETLKWVQKGGWTCKMKLQLTLYALLQQLHRVGAV